MEHRLGHDFQSFDFFHICSSFSHVVIPADTQVYRSHLFEHIENVVLCDKLISDYQLGVLGKDIVFDVSISVCYFLG